MKMPKQAYTQEFKELAVKRVKDEGSLASVAARVGQKNVRVIVCAQSADAELALHGSGGGLGQRQGRQQLLHCWGVTTDGADSGWRWRGVSVVGASGVGFSGPAGGIRFQHGDALVAQATPFGRRAGAAGMHCSV